MSTGISNYVILEQVYESTNTLVYRGRYGEHHVPAMIKVLRSAYPNPRQLASVHHEYDMLNKLSLPGVVHVYGLEPYNQGLALILEDFGGQPLSELLAAKRIDTTLFLRIAIPLVEALGAIHQHHIIHKDIKPQNILVNSDTGQVKIADFGIATRLSQETQQLLSAPSMIEGTLAYISPEQTGRMNRGLDQRTDFYSLGVTFYEILSGSLPFNATDPLELVHSHIAGTPLSLRERSSAIPRQISAIVMKLLSKAAEDRYHTAEGLLADLQECLRQWTANEHITTFPLGQHDVIKELHISQKLYGREAEVSTLMTAFERVSHGATEVMLVSGYSGIGKSSLVQEIHKPIARQHGYFITGKFDQYRRDIPYASIIQAFQTLVQEITAETPDRVSNWKDQLIAALGSNGQLIIEVIPDVELIIGTQPPVSPLGLTEAQQRFKRTFQNFIGVFAKQQHPLVMFLDDVQWADLASLQLLELLVSASATPHLLVICAYRDNEVSAGHPLTLAIETIRKAKTIVNEISLRPLSLEHVNQLLGDTLGMDTQHTEPLAKLVFSKTSGNPFFVNQFLKTLHQDLLVSFDAGTRTWCWNLAGIEAATFADNVIEFMTGRLRKLKPDTQRVLQLAACIGNTFELTILSVINEQSVEQTARALWSAVQEGLLLPLDSGYKLLQSDTPELATILARDDFRATYKFLHDRVQQAAYALIPAEQTQHVHLAIGRLLLKHADAQRREEQVFDIVNQFNLAVEHVVDPAERFTLAQLNLNAGKKARMSAAYAAAAHYFAIAMGLLETDAWHSHYDLTLALYQARAECDYLIGQVETAETLFDAVLAQAHTSYERAEVYVTRMILYTNLGKYTQGLEVGIAGLRLFDMTFPESDEQQQMAIGTLLGEVQQALGDRQIEELLELPELADRDMKMVMRILAPLGPLSFNISPNLFALVVLKMLTISLTYGNSDGSSYAYSSYGLLLVNIFGDYEAASNFGKLSLTLNERFHNVELQHSLNLVVGAFIDHWRYHINSSFQYLNQSYLGSMEMGDSGYAGFAAQSIIYHRFGAGANLDELAEEIPRYLDFMQRTNNEVTTNTLIFFQQIIQNLRGKTLRITSLSDDAFDEEAFLTHINELQALSIVVLYHTYKAQVLCIHEQYADALPLAMQAERMKAVSGSTYIISEQVFYTALIFAALYLTATSDDQQVYWEKLVSYRDQLKVWADNCLENSGARYALIAAEMERISGAPHRAAELYDEAITLAETYGFTQNAAIANERAAIFYLETGRQKIARAYMIAAYEGYHAWGATAKTHALADKYPALISNAVAKADNRTSTSFGSTSDITIYRNAGLLDVTTVIKAANVISGEMVLDKLLDKLMKIVVENAGAQKGVLILKRPHGLIVEAMITTAQQMIATHPGTSVETSNELCGAIVQYVVRTEQPVVLQDATQQNRFANDPYMLEQQPKSLLCLPLLHQGHLTGVLYLENNLATNVFTSERVELLGLLSLQGAIAIENALLYTNVREMTSNLQQINEQLETSNHRLEDNVAQRTVELRDANIQLQHELIERQRAEAERAELQERIIRVQAATLAELSTPLIPLTDRIMVMPLIGTMDSQRAEQVLTSLLHGVSTSRAHVVIVDITGVPVVDTAVASTLLDAAQAVRLLGAQTLITGIRPEVAHTLVSLGVNLAGLITMGTLQSGIAYALRMSGEGVLSAR